MKRSKEKFHLSVKVILRLFVFFFLVYFLINYISSQRQTVFINISLPKISLVQPYLSTFYQKLPPSSRQTLEHLSTSPVIISVQDKINYIRQELVDFPQKQIIEIKKDIIQNVYQNLINDLDKK